MIARLQDSEQRGRDGGHAAGRHQSVFGGFKVRQLAREVNLVRAVAEADVADVAVGAYFSYLVCTGLEDRRHDRPLQSRAARPVDEPSFDCRFLRSHWLSPLAN